MEVSVSSHYDRPKRIKEALKKGKLLYRFDGGAQTEQRPADVSVTASPGNAQGTEKLSPGSERSLTEAPQKAEGPDLVPSSDKISSDGKVNALPSEKQVSGAESATARYGAGQITIRNADGSESRGVLTGIVDEQGRHEYFVEGDLQNMHYATEQELDGIVTDYKPDSVGKETVVKTEPQQPNSAVSSDSSLSAGEQVGTSSTEPNGESAVSTGKVNALPSEKQASGAESSADTALAAVPRDEAGNPLFERAPSAEAGWVALVEFCHGDVSAAKDVAGVMVKEKRKAFEKAQKLKARGKTPQEVLASRNSNEDALANARADYEGWQAIVAAAAEAERRAAFDAEFEADQAQRRAEREARERAEAEEINANLSEEEKDEYGKPLVLAKDGTTTFGIIDAETGLTEAPIRLSLGENTTDDEGKNHGYGLLHIEAGHGDQIRNAGYASVEEFVEEVAKNYTDIREGALIGENQTYLLEVSDDHNNTLFIQLSKDGTYWNVNSAGIFKKKYSRRKPKVYSVPAVGEGTNTDTSEVNSGQTEGATAPAGNSSQTSDRKVTKSLTYEQISGEESSAENRGDTSGYDGAGSAAAAGRSQGEGAPQGVGGDSGSAERAAVENQEATIKDDEAKMPQSLKWSSERAANGEPFLEDANGNIDLVDIAKEVFDKMGIQKAPFRLTPSMVAHVFERHRKELKLKTPEEAVEAILNVMRNFDHVRRGRGNTFVFSIEGNRTKSARRAITFVLEYDKGEWLGIKTFGYDHISNIQELTTLWEKGEEESSATGVATANVTSDQSSQGDGTDGIASNQSAAISADKGTTLSAEEQISSKESSAENRGDTSGYDGADAPLSLDDMRGADGSAKLAGNRLVSEERYAELKARMKRKLGGQLNMGIDPEILAIGAEMAVYHIEKGARKFTEFARGMIADFGDAIRPYLKSFYNAVRDMPEAESAGFVGEMDSYEAVSKIDIANFDKESTDVIARAAGISAEIEAEKQREEAERKLKSERDERKRQERGDEPFGLVGGEDYVALAARASEVGRSKRDAEDLAGYVKRTEELALDLETTEPGPAEIVGAINELQSMWEATVRMYGEEPAEESAGDALRLIERELQRWRGRDVVLAESRSAVENTAAKLATEEHADSESKDSAEAVEESAAAGSIQDWGEEIWGARKNIMKDIARKLDNVTAADLLTNPLSKVFKATDWKKYVEKGELTADDALILEAITQLILRDKKPRELSRNSYARRRGEEAIKAWAERVAFYIDKLRAVCVATTAEERAAAVAALDMRDMSAMAERRASSLKLNPGRIDGGLYAPAEIDVIKAVLEGLGYPANDADKAKFATISTDTFGTCYEVRLDGKYFGRHATYDKALEVCTKIAKVSRGDSDVMYAPDDFAVTVASTTRRATGKWSVVKFGGRDMETVGSGMSKEEAEALVKERSARSKRAEYSIYEEKENEHTYNATIRNIVSGEKIALQDVPVFETVAECRAWIEDNIESLQEKANAAVVAQTVHKEGEAAPVHFQVEINRDKNGTYFVWAPLSKRQSSALGNMVVFVKGLPSYKEARQWVERNRENLDKWEASRKERMRNYVYFRPAVPRRGKDYRNGRNVSEGELGETFGFRGVQFGNWTNQRDRQQSVNEAYDALMDLAGVLGISPKAIGLNGELGIAFGARGSGNANAHYERDNVVINLTKTRGAGSLAHEWWHALDNYFARRGGIKTGMMTQGANAEVRSEVLSAFTALTTALNGSAYDRRCQQRGEYWGSPIEESARLFAEWVDRRLAAEGGTNSFLSAGVPASVAEGYRRKNYELYKWLTELSNV